MAIRPGPGSCAIIGRLLACCIAFHCTFAGAGAVPVRAENYHAFWLWAGVQPQPALKHAEEIYLLAGEVRGRPRREIISQRSATPHVAGSKIWIVYRAQTVDWSGPILTEVLRHVESWRRAGNDVIGLQIDFDAGTKHLERYAEFLRALRANLPSRYRLGVTGLLDWSANGPQGLRALSGVVDEVILQIYQGRHVIPGYAGYLAKLNAFSIPFKIGLLQGGEWQAPAGLEQNSLFKGYVVFLLNSGP